MSAVYPTLPKLAVRDNLDDDDLTDIDDEVFIRDGRNGGLKLDDDGGVKQPLMAPRRKCKKPCNLENYKIPYNMLLVPVCCGTTALIVLLGLIVVCIFTANILPMPLTILKSWMSHDLKNPINESEIIPCTSLSSSVLWARSFPKLTPEAPLRNNDVNSDGIEDIIVGFSTGLDMMDTEYICTIYFGNQTPCLGGVLALNGKTGEPIWTHWTAHSILSVDCDADLTNDKVKDCIISGRGGILQAIDGHDGSNIWEIPLQDLISKLQIISDVYDARFIADMDGDGIADVIASHVVQSDNIQASNVLVISGKSGSVIGNMNLPDTEQLFVAPQIIVHPDGENIFVLATTSQQDSGGLYIVSQANIFYGNLQLQKLNHNTGKNALLPPILIDITSDGIEDIVAAMFNSIIAYNGTTFEPIWNYTVPNSEVISIPIPGYYNDDDIPDFMVKHQIGTDLSTYYYTVATVIDGRNGQPLLEKPMEDSLSGQMSGLSVTVDGFGNDWFLHWSTDCLNYEGIKEKYQFLKDQSFMSQTRTDLCSLRFNSTLTMRLLALSQHVGPPGLSLYFSEDWKSVEINNSVDLRQEEEKNLKSHSQLKVTDTYSNIPLVSERSPKVHKNHRKDNIFKHKDSLLEIGKYDSDAVYENFDEFKSHKKHNPEDTVENLNVDQAWKQDNKWMEDDVQPDKEYDSIYENDNGNNEDGQSVDYSQGEVREQRSVVPVIKDIYSINISHKEINSTPESTRHNLRLDHEEINIEKKRKMEEINKKNDSMNEADDIMNISMTSTSQFPKLSLIMSNNKSNIEKSTTIQNVLKTSELIKIKSTNMSTELPEDTHTEASNVTQNQIITGHPDATSTAKKVVDVPQGRHIYKHSFPNIVQDADDDASIEKVFKRESLKNQSKGKINKKQLLILSSTDRVVKIRQKRRTKRNSEINNNQSNGINGIQKQAPTGILLPSIIESKGKTSIDLVFPTFWLPSSEVSLILSRADVECIGKKKALLEDKLEYKKDDDIISECLSERGINYRLYQEAMDRENTKIAFGQMTIYRMKLECVCPEDMLPNQTCKNISIHQSWPEYLGSSGNGYFKPLHKLNI
ncbi:F234B protein, partial [Pseudoatta argentina]